jgi:hypothetical protein
VSENVRFTSRQLKAIEWFATPKFDRHPPTQKLLADELGCHDKTITRWKKNQAFKDAVLERARELLGSRLPEIYGALGREAEKGNIQHIKLSLEMTGEYTENKTITLKVEREMERLLDTLEQELDDDSYRNVLTALSGGEAGPPEA